MATHDPVCQLQTRQVHFPLRARDRRECVSPLQSPLAESCPVCAVGVPARSAPQGRRFETWQGKNRDGLVFWVHIAWRGRLVEYLNLQLEGLTARHRNLTFILQKFDINPTNINIF
jgi:hypothetical protein